MTTAKNRFCGQEIFGFVAPKGTPVGHNSYSGALTMSVSAAVPEKLHQNKKCAEEEEDELYFLAFGIL